MQQTAAENGLFSTVTNRIVSFMNFKTRHAICNVAEDALINKNKL